MFTLGRDREKAHARRNMGRDEDPLLINAVIDAVHDLLDGIPLSDGTLAVFRAGFIDGGRATWDQTGTWLAKACREFPSLEALWHEFAQHRSALIRIRAAAFLLEMPEVVTRTILPALLVDGSANVRSKAAGELHFSRWPWAFKLLSERRLVETNPAVLASIDFALESRPHP